MDKSYQNGWKLPKMAGNGPELLEIAQNGFIWPKMDKSDKNG